MLTVSEVIESDTTVPDAIQRNGNLNDAQMTDLQSTEHDIESTRLEHEVSKFDEPQNTEKISNDDGNDKQENKHKITNGNITTLKEKVTDEIKNIKVTDVAESIDSVIDDEEVTESEIPGNEELISKNEESSNLSNNSDSENSEQEEVLDGATEEYPFLKSVKYLEKHAIFRLFQNLAADVVYHRPDNPLQFIVEKLKQDREDNKPSEEDKTTYESGASKS